MEDETPNLRDYWPHEDTWKAALGEHHAEMSAIQERREDLARQFQKLRKQAT
jgi:hypothetical protein